MTEQEKAIGVFDSGVGGLTVVRELLDRLPAEDIIYFGDSARVPYGSKSPETVLRFSRQNLAFLESKHVKLIVVACNTASSLALPALEAEEELPLVGVLLPGARAAARETRNRRVAVIGTTATIGSGAYERAIHGIDPAIEIWSGACPLFVPLVEEGWLDDEVTRLTAARYLEPVRDFGADTIVLGCTHYPLLEKTIAGAAAPGVVLVDSARETAIEVERLLDGRGIRTPSSERRRLEIYVSDLPARFRDVAERFLGRPVERVERVRF